MTTNDPKEIAGDIPVADAPGGAPGSVGDRHEMVFALHPDRHPVSTLIEYLGDPSWRVRKAAVAVVDRYRVAPELVAELVRGLGSEDNAGLRNSCSEALVSLGEAAVDEVARHLRTADQDQRKFVVEVLGAVGTTRARDILTSALDDADVNVRTAVAEALGRIGGHEIITRVRAKLGQSRHDIQQSVYLLDALASARARLPFEELEEFIGKAPVARSLYPVLGLTGDRRALQPLVEGTARGSEGTRHVAIIALTSLITTADESMRATLAELLRARPKVIERLHEALDAEDDRVAAAAIQVLAVLDDAEMAPRFLAAVACRAVVETGMQAVLRLGRRAVRPLLDDFDRVGVEARVLFLEALETIGDDDVVTELLELAGNLETRSAEAALRALGSLGDETAVAPLMELARKEDPELARQAAYALGAIGVRCPAPVAEQVRAAIQGGDMRPAWLDVLGALGRPEDVAIVEAGSRHTDAEVRRAAVEAAPSFGTAFPYETLVFALTDEHPTVRLAAARGLGSYRSDEVVEALLAVARDPDSWVVSEALRALGAVGGPKVVPTLMSAVGSTSAPIAISALQSLFRLNPANIETAVRKALEHVDPEVVREALDVTIRLPAQKAGAILIDCLSHRSWNVRRAAAEGLANRCLPVPSRVLEARLKAETEPLVREELERLEREGGR